jgi:predicted metal-dependent enzyme (double-stranded beta helix superfamily)
MGNSSQNSVKDCADALIAAIGRCGDDVDRLRQEFKAPMARLMTRPDLLSVGIPRQGNNVAFSQYLYYDGQLSILLYQVPKDKPIPAHDHGIWETVFVYRGRLKHVVYQRMDDGSKPGFADLKVTDDRILEQGEMALVAPPHDIHSFTGLTDETFGITVVNAAYKPDRHYYNPERKTYEVKGQLNAR